jgi:protein involved in polysaccharide export with SLBB domain
VELTSLLERLAPRPVAAAAADVARHRLAAGDLQAGDGIALVVEGEPQFSDTFVVGPGREITLPMVGAVTLGGVLYAEIESYLALQLGQFLREPVVHARGLVRLSVTGAVPRPGFYLVPADALLSEAVMVAGGLTPDSKLSALRAERAGAPLLAGADMRKALAEGRTLDQANVRSGDELVMPGRRGGMSSYEQARLVGILLSIPLTIYSLTRIF